MTMTRLAAAMLVAAACFGSSAFAAEADDYPSRPIRLVVPAAPGGISDLLARLVSDDLDRNFGQRVIVDNRGGAGGNLGAEMVAKAAPDGYSLCLIQFGNVAVNPHLYKNLSFDPLKDLVPVAPVASSAQMVVAYPGLPANNLTELIALAKQEPGKISYGSAGIGTSTHLAAELLEQMAHIKLLHVPYRGMGPALVDLTAGRVQLAFVGLAATKSQIDAGTLKVLAVAQPTRLKAAPNIPSADAEFIGLQAPEDALLLNIVTLHGDGRATVNLKGPIVLNRSTWIGKQSVPTNAADYSTQHPLATN